MYLYETHVHSNRASACAWNTPKEMVQAYKQAGYTGLILTDHFIKGNTSVPKDLDWESRMHMYYDAYLGAKEEGDKLDFDVFFGIEHWYEKSKEILVYGIDLDFLLAHPELNTADIYTFSHFVHEAGGVMVHAHPHRIRAYIDPKFQPIYEVCDGIEVYNAADPMEINELGMKDALALGKLMTSGGDVHTATEQNIGKAGVAFERRIRDGRDFVEALRKGEGHIVMNGEICAG
jgi:predicted metal-dependent phosphoesterase TrpH